MKGKSVWIFLLVFFLTSVSADPNSAKPDPAELKQLDKQIQKLQHEIQADQGTKGQLTQQWKNNVKQLDKLKHREAILQKELNKQQSALNELQKKQQNYHQQINQQQQALNQQIFNTYQLLLLANEEGVINPDRNQMEVLLDYYQFQDQAKLMDLSGLKQTVEILGSESHETDRHKTAIQSQITKQEKPQQKLALATQNQQQALSHLTTQIEGKSTKLKQLIADRRALDQLIKSLQQKAAIKSRAPTAHTPTEPPSYVANQPFAQQQGKLPWPIKGTVINHYGGPILQSGLKYTGILIAGNVGQPVQAVAPGEVVFANWLQGLGLLIIIDHGDGYMTLYGHNQALYKKAGDRVNAKEMIATLGKSSETRITALYFEVRHNGQPSDPGEWLFL